MLAKPEKRLSEFLVSLFFYLQTIDVFFELQVLYIRTLMKSAGKNIKLISFDCYGTLIDWKKGVLNSLTPLFDEYLLDVSKDEIFTLFKKFEAEIVLSDFMYYRNVLNEIMKKFSTALNINLMKADLDCLVNSLPNWEPFQDIGENLHKLKRKYKLALITNSDNDLIEKNLVFLGVSFDYMVTSADLGSYKPSQNNFIEALRIFKLPPDQIIHVAQSTFHDIAPCNQLGINNIWINRYNEPFPDQEKEKPGIEIRSMRELSTIV